MKTKEAVEILIEALKSDPNYRRLWKDNIAMAFKDEAGRLWEMNESAKRTVHVMANNAADNFLNMLCGVCK